MSLTHIDRCTALIVIDLQRGFATLPLEHPFADIVARAGELATTFRARELPVIIVNNDGAAPGRREVDAVAAHRGDGWTEIVPELPLAPTDHRITKSSPGAFTGTGLATWLRGRCVTQVVIAGIATGTAIETTARQAYEEGFNVTLATDAMSDMDGAVHANSVQRIFPRIGETGGVAEIAALLGAPGGGVSSA